MAIVNGYCSLVELKERIQVADVVDDTQLEDIITSSSRQLDNYCDRHFYQVTETRYFEPPARGNLLLGPFSDLVSITSFKIDTVGDGTFSTTWTTADYELIPRVGAELGPYVSVRRVGGSWPNYSSSEASRIIEIAGTWGWPAVPAPVKSACLIQAQREVHQRYMPGEDTAYLPWVVVEGLLDPYRLIGVT